MPQGPITAAGEQRVGNGGPEAVAQAPGGGRAETAGPSKRQGAARRAALALVLAAAVVLFALAGPGASEARAQISTTGDGNSSEAEQTDSSDSSDSSDGGGLAPTSFDEGTDEGSDGGGDPVAGADDSSDALPEASPGGAPAEEGTTAEEPTTTAADEQYDETTAMQSTTTAADEQYDETVPDQLVYTGGSGSLAWAVIPAIAAATIAGAVLFLVLGRTGRRPGLLRRMPRPTRRGE